MGWYIGIGVIVILAAYAIYNYQKIKNAKEIPPSNKIRHLTNKNFKTVIRSGGLVLVDFWAPWCGPCKVIAPTLNEIAEEYSDHVTIGKVNVDQNQALSQKYSIRNIPTLILYDNGKEIKRITGVKPKRTLLKEIGIR